MEDWKTEYLELASKKLTQHQVDLLINGPKNLSQAWSLGAMKMDWKKRTKN